MRVHVKMVIDGNEQLYLACIGPNLITLNLRLWVREEPACILKLCCKDQEMHGRPLSGVVEARLSGAGGLRCRALCQWIGH